MNSSRASAAPTSAPFNSFRSAPAWLTRSTGGVALLLFLCYLGLPMITVSQFVETEVETVRGILFLGQCAVLAIFSPVRGIIQIGSHVLLFAWAVRLVYAGKAEAFLKHVAILGLGILYFLGVGFASYVDSRHSGYYCLIGAWSVIFAHYSALIFFRSLEKRTL